VRAGRLYTVEMDHEKEENDGLSFECPLPLHLNTKKQ